MSDTLSNTDDSFLTSIYNSMAQQMSAYEEIKDCLCQFRDTLERNFETTIEISEHSRNISLKLSAPNSTYFYIYLNKTSGNLFFNNHSGASGILRDLVIQEPDIYFTSARNIDFLPDHTILSPNTIIARQTSNGSGIVDHSSGISMILIPPSRAIHMLKKAFCFYLDANNLAPEQKQQSIERLKP